MRNIAVGIGGYIVNTLLGFVCRIVFVRFLPDDYLGVSGFFSNILSMLTIAELGIGIAIVYALYKPIAENDTEKVASLMQFFGKAYRIIGVVTALLGLAVAPFLKYLVEMPDTITESIYFLYWYTIFLILKLVHFYYCFFSFSN